MSIKDDNIFFLSKGVQSAIPGHFYMKDKQGTYICCNDEFAVTLGFDSANDIIGMNDYELIEKNLADNVAKIDKKIITQGISLTVEEKGLAKNKIKAIYLTRKKPLINNKGNIIGLIGISIDITSYKEHEHEIIKNHRQTESAFTKIISFIPGNVYWIDKKGICLWCNDNLVKLIKFKSRDDIVGKSPYAFMPSKIAEQTKKADLEVIKTGTPRIIEETGIAQDGLPAFYFSHKVPLFDEYGNITGLLGISIDITDRKKAEEELKKAKEVAERANELKTQFISNMEHDIRTPAGGISEMTKILATDEPNPTRKEQLGYVAEASKQLLDLLNNILAFDYVESGRIPILNKKFSIKDTIYNILALEEPAAELKQLNLTAKISESVPEHLVGDEYRLKRILINLISNSIKFTDKGYVKIIIELLKRLDTKTCLLKISVQDTGIGIPQDKQNILYEKFTRGTPSNKGIYTGTGLGLRIVRQFIDEIEGEIEVDSTVGLGTAFSCIIPYKIPLAD
jgi:two-component system aerobic respiration control sensor histidine kinase ArcB